jgi:roadblock/LC7 domain-containing protein
MSMADLDQLMKLENVEGAFRFDAKGELQEYRVTEGSELNDKVLDLLSHVCVANMAIATMQARGWESVTGSSGFYPIEAIGLIGYDWTAIVNDEHGVIVPNDKVDFEAAFSALKGSAADA